MAIFNEKTLQNVFLVFSLVFFCQHTVCSSQKLQSKFVKNEFLHLYNNWISNTPHHEPHRQSSQNICYKHHKLPTMCQPVIQQISNHKMLKVRVFPPLSINLTASYMVDVKSGVLKHDKGGTESNIKNEKVRNNHTKLKKKRLLSPNQIEKYHPLKYLTDSHNPTYPSCWIFSSLFPQSYLVTPSFQSSLNKTPHFIRPFEYSKTSPSPFSDDVSNSKQSKKRRKLAPENSRSIHSFLSNLNYTNINLTLKLDKKFELDKISLSFCARPESMHVSLLKMSNDGKSTTPLHHFSDACASILAREPASKHPLKDLRVHCSAWFSRFRGAKDRIYKRTKFERENQMKYNNSKFMKLQHSNYILKKLNNSRFYVALSNDVPFESLNKSHATRPNLKRGMGEYNCSRDMMEEGKVCHCKCCGVQNWEENVCQKVCLKTIKKMKNNKIRKYSKNLEILKLRKKASNRNFRNFRTHPNSHCSNFTNLKPNNNFHSRAKLKKKHFRKCSNLKVTFDLLKGRSRVENSPLIRDWITASEIVVSVYFHERLERIQSILSSLSTLADSPSMKSSTSSVASSSSYSSLSFSSLSPTSKSTIPSLKHSTFSLTKEDTRYRNDIEDILRLNLLSVGDISVEGRCKCNGHASQCIRNQHGLFVCQCQHNTFGDDCQKCRPFYQNKPWQRGTKEDAGVCEACECNRHTRRCRFSRELYEMSSRQGGATCIRCGHNTAGRHCHYCKPGYRRHPGRPIWHRMACVKCNCHVLGAKGSWCDPTTGQCECREGVGGLRCHTCLSGYRQNRSPTYPCVKNQDNRTEAYKSDQHKKRNTNKNLIACSKISNKTRLRLDTFCQSKYVIKANLERVEKRDDWVWLGLFIEHSYKHTEGKVQRKRGEALVRRSLFDCHYFMHFKLNHTYLILSRSEEKETKLLLQNLNRKKIVLERNLISSNKHLKTIGSSDKFFNNPETLITNPISFINDQSSINNDSKSSINASTTFSPSPSPFIITENDMVVGWKGGMGASLIRLVRHQQRGKCARMD